MSNNSGVSSQIISAPRSGGALQGIGESFSPDLHTGTGNFTVPIGVPAGRNGFQPELRLVYSTGNGNGPFGFGWTLSVPGVARKTSKGIPRYRDETDTFVLSGEEDLVAVEHLTTHGPDEARTRYQPRTEGLFAQIVHQRSPVESFWKVSTKDGLLSLYGTPRPIDAPPEWTDQAALADAANARHIAVWRLTATRDPFGNRIDYEYERTTSTEPNRQWNQLYLKRIRYVDFGDRGAADQFLVSIEFVYEERPDPFSDYRSGFEIRTTRRCKRIEIHTHAKMDRLARSYDFTYLDERSDLPDREVRVPNHATLLSQIHVVGHDGEQTEDLPPLQFGYTPFEPRGRTFIPLTGAEMPPLSLAHPNLEIGDLFGTGLPDIFEMSGTVRYWRNLGDGRFDLPRDMHTAPAGLQLADAAVQLLDANGDGRLDLLVASSELSGYFPLRFQGEWDRRSFHRYRQAPSFSLKDPEVKLLDLTGDGVTDALRSGERLEAFFNDPEAGWTKTRRIERKALEGFPSVSFSDPRVKWGDMSGDGLQDIVLVHDGVCVYWPNLGYGDWGKPIYMRNSPRFPYGYDPRRILVGDTDGDGAADIVYVDDQTVTLWINKSGNGFSEPIVITGTPPVSDVDAVRLADMLGSGVSGVLWSADLGHSSRQSMFFLDFTGGVKPYLLREMDNHVGAVTRVQYSSTTQFLVEDYKTPATRWRTPLPFPVQVVKSVDVIDELSHGKITTEYRYHHGYWDGAEREFRGFGLVEQLDTETFQLHSATRGTIAPLVNGLDSQRFSPPTCTKTWFHQGPVGDEFGEWAELDLAGDFWTGDLGVLDHKTGVDGFLATLELRRMRRDALRTLRGSILRSELYAFDGSERADRPYTVTEHAYGLRQEALEVDAEGAAVFFPHAIASRTTQWERGDDPLTRFAFTESKDYDQFGQVRQSTSIACPRGWRTRQDRPSEPFLATRDRTTYAQALGVSPIHNRVARTTSYELKHGGLVTIDQLRHVPDSDPSLDPIGQTCNYYDGAAFKGLPLGELGAFGALSRTERLVLTESILENAFRSGATVLNPPELPPYLDPVGAPEWTADYPDEFRARVPGLAGYVFHPGGPHPEDLPGYFTQSARCAYDFQESASTTGRGLVLRIRDPLGHETEIGYDSFALLPVSAIDAAQLLTSADYDYRTLQPALIVDANANTSAFTFTPLGLLKEAFARGRPGEGDLIAPSIRMTYDFFAFIASKRLDPSNLQPVFVHSIRRVHHDSETDVPHSERDDIIESRQYSDGFGRLLQNRTQAEDLLFGDPVFGNAILPSDQRDERGTRAVVTGRERAPGDPPNVVAGNWQIYDNKGRVVEKYEPFYSTGFHYASPTDAQLGQKVEMFYDPRGQVIRSRNPDGSEQRVVFGVPNTIAAEDLGNPDVFEPTPWAAYTYDPNDNAGRTHPATSAGYRHHWDTPGSVVIDALGRAILTVERNREPPANGTDPLPPIVEIATRSTYDIRGNLLTLTDGLGRRAFAHIYDLTDRSLRVESIDAGIRRAVLDAAGNGIEHRDGKGALVLIAADALNRTTHLWARDVSGEAITLRERLLYGDEATVGLSAQQVSAGNLRGKLYRHYDEAGRRSVPNYDFKGNLREAEREVVNATQIMLVFAQSPVNQDVSAYRIDWAPEGDSTPGALEARAAILLDPVVYRTSSTFDALDRAKTVRYPRDVGGGRQELRPRYNRAGSLEHVSLGAATYVQHIAYNAKGQRSLIAYGNGLMTRCEHDPKTFRLTRVRTERFTPLSPVSYQPSGTLRQDFAYAFDLVGNVSTIRDRTPGGGIPSSLPGSNTLVRAFSYDALYRLQSATGRECDRPLDVPWDDTPRCVDLTRTRAYVEQYRYDQLGNILQLKHLVNPVGSTRDFTLLPNNSTSQNNRVQRMTIGADTYRYTYDPNGNTTSETTSRHFEWDHSDRMRVFRTQTTGAAPTVHAHYLYGSDDQRVMKLVRRRGGVIDVTISIDGIFEHHKHTAGGSTRENNSLHVLDDKSRVSIVRVGQPFQSDAGPAVRYQLGDHLSSSNLVIGGATANVADFVNREEYTPYGETSFGSFGRKRYRFSGKERDEESGLYCHARRYYAPWSARWISCDPAGPVDGPNLYGYVRTPMSMRDRSGTQVEGLESVGDGTNPQPTTNLGPEPQVPAYRGGMEAIESGAGPAIRNTGAAAAATSAGAGKVTIREVTVVGASPPPVVTLPEMVIEGEIPFEPDVSHPKALEGALGAGHIELGDVKAFSQGLVNGPSSWLGLPQFEIDPRFEGAAMMGHELGQNLAADGAGGAIAKGGSLVLRSLRPATKCSQAYRVVTEVELTTRWPRYLSDAGRRARHQAEATEKVAEWMSGLRKSVNPNDRALAKSLDSFLADSSEFALHHHPQREGVMQLVPQADHWAAEFQDVLHPLIGKPWGKLGRVGGFFLWGHKF